jgi:hypothetical protein
MFQVAAIVLAVVSEVDTVREEALAADIVLAAEVGIPVEAIDNTPVLL